MSNNFSSWTPEDVAAHQARVKGEKGIWSEPSRFKLESPEKALPEVVGAQAIKTQQRGRKVAKTAISGDNSKPSKYRNRKKEVDGIVFDSEKEARRYTDLKLMERAGEITALELQPEFRLEVNGRHICTYRADFSYLPAVRPGLFLNTRIIEDVKGVLTPVYRLKKKLMLACWGIEITEV